VARAVQPAQAFQGCRSHSGREIPHYCASFSGRSQACLLHDFQLTPADKSQHCALCGTVFMESLNSDSRPETEIKIAHMQSKGWREINITWLADTRPVGTILLDSLKDCRNYPTWFTERQSLINGSRIDVYCWYNCFKSFFCFVLQAGFHQFSFLFLKF